MIRHITMENRTGQRYPVSFPVEAEWKDKRSGKRITTEGSTTNIGPEGALVHLELLPDVGSRLRLRVLDGEAQTRAHVQVEVLRLERNPVQPLAALQLVDQTDSWRGKVWEAAANFVEEPDEEEDFD